MPNIHNYVVKSLGFQDCCGIFILHGFYTNPPPTFPDYKINYGSYRTEVDWKSHCETQCETKVEYETRMKTQISKFTEALKNKKSYYIAVTNTHEKGYGIEEILLDLGWEISVPETRNPTGTAVTMWIYHLLPRVKQETKSIFNKSKKA